MSNLEIHFLDVGCGNMTLILFPNGTTYLYDCNITDDNAACVLTYLKKAMVGRKSIDVFVCSHRDCDHMRGLRRVHNRYPIGTIRDAGVEGTSCDAGEYLDYMRLRREIGSSDIKPMTYLGVDGATVRFMNAAYEDLWDANDQSVVMKVEFGTASALLAGDTSFRPWKDKILPYYSDAKIQTEVLLASHHGSLAFFDDPSDERNYYTTHLRKLSPAMTLVSVGVNVHDLPDSKALEMYEKYSRGSNKGNKVYRTDHQGNMKLTLNGKGWSLSTKQ